jgi:helicase MOV-10
MYDTLNAGTPYKRKQATHIRFSESAIIKNDNDNRRQKGFKVSLGTYEIPKVMKSGEFQSFELEQHLIDMKNSLEVKDYSKYFSDLLFFEELQWDIDIRLFDMNQVPVFHDGPYLRIEVPGLQENRPSVMRGDQIIFIYNGENYEGDVMRVELNHVLLSFNSKLHRSIVNNTRVDVVFRFKRTTLRLNHQGLEILKSVVLASQIIHPFTSNETSRVMPIRTFFNRNLNDQQKQAVTTACSGNFMPAPFCIFGPPGKNYYNLCIYYVI